MYLGQILIPLFGLLVVFGVPVLIVFLIIFTNNKRIELQKKSDQYLEDIHTIAENSKIK